jgi:hypothetical protein
MKGYEAESFEYNAKPLGPSLRRGDALFEHSRLLRVQL